MKSFYIASALYLVGSIVLYLMMLSISVFSRKAFVRRFGDRRLEDLDEEQTLEWSAYHEARFNSGFWRAVLLLYLFYHYPGLFLSAMFKKDSPHPAVMFVASAIFWIGVLFLIMRPQVEAL